MATWPASLKILRDGFSESPPNRVIKTDMGSGPAKLRRRNTSAVRPISFKLFLTNSEYQILDEFYLQNDATAFDFTHPRTSTVVRARFTAPPAMSANETMFDVTVQLEILP